MFSMTMGDDLKPNKALWRRRLQSSRPKIIVLAKIASTAYHPTTANCGFPMPSKHHGRFGVGRLCG
jgi:hypothetical protein